jgi:hypothetical protein
MTNLFSQRAALSQIPTTGDHLLASHIYGRDLPHALQQCLHLFSQRAALSQKAHPKQVRELLAFLSIHCQSFPKM